MSRGLYFPKALLEGLIFGGAYIQVWGGGGGLSMEGKLHFEVDCASVTVGRKFTVVLLYFTLYLRAISKYKPSGGLYLEGAFNGRFLRYKFGGLIFGGAYTWRGLFCGLFCRILR